jgi:hypothetical protein
MKNRSNDSSPLSRSHIAPRLLFLGAALVCLTLLVPEPANAQSLPAEAYGPYNATFLVDGPAISKPLTPPSPIDPRTAAMLDRMGMGGRQSDSHDALLAGHAAWTLAFCFGPRSRRPARFYSLVLGTRVQKTRDSSELRMGTLAYG